MTTTLQASTLLKNNRPVWLVTAIAALAQLMIVLDERVVNVALPAIRRDLGLTVDTQQWAITAYLITFGGLLLLGARANDLFGRRRVFQLGLVIFTVASLAGGFALDGTMLIVARLLQGVGAAILAPASLTLIAAAHPEPAARRQAMGVWGTVTAAGAAAGVVLGGVLTELLGWRSVMFVNVPVGIALMVAAALVLVPSSAVTRESLRIDWAGAATVTGGIAALVYGISAVPASGWGSTTVIAALSAAVLLIAAFIVLQLRLSRPLVDFGLLRLRPLRNANLAILAFGATLTGSLYYLSLYLQQLGEYSPLEAGLALLPMSVMLGVGSLVTPRLLRSGTRHLPSIGALVAAAGLVWLGFAPASAGYLGFVLAPSLVMGAGFSVVLVALTGTATTGVPPQQLGTASGLLNVGRQLGGAVGLALFVTVTSAVAAPGHGTPLDGFHTGFWLSAGLAVVTAILAAFSERAPRKS